jgi:HK97 family phage major capsid protein
MATMSIHHELGSIAAEMRKVNDNKEGWSAAEVEERFDALNKRAVELELSAQDSARWKRIEQLATKANDAQLRSAPAPLARLGGSDVTATPEYRAAFWNYLRTGNVSEVRAISTGTSNIGVPSDMYKQIIEKLYDPVTLVGQVSRVSVDGDKKIPIGGSLPASNFITEGSSISGTDPTFSTQITVDPKKVVTRNVVSIEALADAVGNPDMQGYIMRQQATSMNILLEKAMVQGGVTDAWTNGLMIAAHTASQKVTGGNKYANITGDNLIDCAHKVKPQYRTGNFRWILDDDALKSIRKVKISSAGTAGDNEYVWKVGANQDLTGGIPGTIYGIPYTISQQIDQSAIATGNKTRVMVGNLDYATLFERQGMTMLVDPYSGSANLQVNLFTYARYDFHVTLPEAFAGITFVQAE